jgi:hypothetical protein
MSVPSIFVVLSFYVYILIIPYFGGSVHWRKSGNVIWRMYPLADFCFILPFLYFTVLVFCHPELVSGSYKKI